MLRTVRRTMARIAVTALLAGAGTATAIAIPTAAQASPASMEAQFVAKINAARQAHGLAPYSVASDLTSVARSHSRQMAAKQSLYHNPNLTTDVQNWQAVGENVGEGPTVDDIHTAFMNSTEHRDNILDHDFTQVGVGVSVDSNGIIWVTEDFRQPMHSSSSSSTAPTHTAPRQPATTTRHYAPTRTASKPATVSRPASTTPKQTPSVRPSATATPAAVLRARLAQMRTAAAAAQSNDPVSQTFSYLDNLTTLTG